MSFCNRFISFSRMSSRFIFCCSMNLCICVAEFLLRQIMFHCLYISYSFYSCVDGQGCLYILVIVNNIAMNTRTQIALCNLDFSSFREVPKSGTVGSQCFHFNFFEEPLYWFPWYLYCFTGKGNGNPLQYSWLENSTGNGD